MIRACLCMLTGVYALQLSSFAVLAVLIITVVLAGRPRIALFVTCGAILFLGAANSVMESRVDPANVGDSIMVDVRVEGFPTRRGQTVSFIGDVADNPWVPQRVRVSWFAPSRPPKFGDRWQLELRLRRPRGSSNPGGFDYETWLFRERISATAYVVDSSRNKFLGRADLDIIEGFRRGAVERIERVVDDPEIAAVLIAISVGARHQLSSDAWTRYARTGTSHLMAISGLHIGLAAGGGYLLALLLSGLLLRNACHRQLATIAAVLVACGYALVSGLGVPAQRASLMIGLGAVAVLRRREVRPILIVAAACVAIMSIGPLTTMAPGFKLSFLAVILLVMFAQRRQRFLPLVFVQLYLFFGLMPMTGVIFGRVSFAAPFVNLVAIPVFSFVTVPFALTGLVAGDWLLIVAAESLEWTERLIAFAADLPFSAQSIAGLAGGSCLLLLVPLAWVLLPRGFPARWIAVIGVLALALYKPPVTPPGCADIEVLDVGQGLAVGIRTASHVTVYDTGPIFRGGANAAQSIVLPYLRHRAIEGIDRLVVSHADLDHSGGVSVLAASVPIAMIMRGEPFAGEVSPTACEAGDRWSADGVEFAVLWPQRGAVVTGNNASCVVQLTAGSHRLLLTGDIERDAEQQLVRQGALQPVAVVVVPHHGSATSSTAEFVRSLRPELAIVSAGFGNRWNLPDAEVVRRWQDAGARILSTATDGAVSLRLCRQGGVSALRLSREAKHRIWHE